MAWTDHERSYYFGDPFAINWDISLFCRRYFGGPPEIEANHRIPAGAAVNQRLCRTLFRLSQLAPDAAHLMRDGCDAVAVTALHNGGNLQISWPCCIWVARGSNLLAIPSGLVPEGHAIYVGVPSQEPNSRLRGVARHPHLHFVEVTDQMLGQNAGMPTWPIDGGLTEKHHERMLDTVAERHPDRDCVVPADQEL